jgi:hypothetical protein
MPKKLKNSEKRFLIALAIVAVISGIMLYDIYGPQPIPDFSQSESSDSKIETTETSTSSKPIAGGTGGSRGVSTGSRGRSSASSSSDITNIAQHNKPNDCWVTIGGETYNITGFVQDYQKNDSSITNFCGTYGFEAGFLEQNSSLRDIVLRNSIKIP